uniref:Uncharacterized protein n=1 Tax=Chenopodium quinoa TaxID=63459 RepID=A0A803MRB8_CHEQI
MLDLSLHLKKLVWMRILRHQIYWIFSLILAQNFCCTSFLQ